MEIVIDNAMKPPDMIKNTLSGNVDRAKMGVVQGAMDTFGTSFSSVSGILAGTIMIMTFPANVFFIMSGGFIALSITISMFKALRQVKV